MSWEFDITSGSKLHLFIHFFSHHNFATRWYCWTAHVSIVSSSLSISCRVFPACKQTRTRSFPRGTVGAIIGRTMSPRSWQYRARSRGRLVRIEKIGDRWLYSIWTSDDSILWRISSQRHWKYEILFCRFDWNCIMIRKWSFIAPMYSKPYQLCLPFCHQFIGRANRNQRRLAHCRGIDQGASIVNQVLFGQWIAQNYS